MALPIYQLSILNNVPQAASGATVYVYTQPTTGITPPTEDGYGNSTPGVWTPSAAPLATIYFDNAGADQMPNPFQLDGNANGWFYATSGLYTVVVTGSNLASALILVDQALLTTSAGGTTFETNGVANSNQALLNLVQGSNVTITSSGGNVTINGSAAGVTFQTNSTNNSSQTVLNLIAGSGITLTDEGSGEIQFDVTSGLALEVNGTPNGSQTLLNLVAGSHVTITDDMSGNITFASAYPIFQANSTPLTSTSTVNFAQGSGIVITNPSAGNVNIAVASSFAPVVLQNTVTLTTANILALNTTEFQLIPAQGMGTIIVPVSTAVFEFDYVTAAFGGTSTSDLQAYLGTGNSANLFFAQDSTGLLDQTAQTFKLGSFTFNPPSASFVANAPLLLASGTTFTGGGTSTLSVTVNYIVYQVVG